MRISDWSSDVCSSDLGGLRPAQRPGSGRVLGNHGAPALGRHRPAAGRAHALRRRGFARAGADRARLPARARGRDRSEEHTSELQSLMRISYAVFCLKKKKKLLNPDMKYIQYYSQYKIKTPLS